MQECPISPKGMLGLSYLPLRYLSFKARECSVHPFLTHCHLSFKSLSETLVTFTSALVALPHSEGLETVLNFEVTTNPSQRGLQWVSSAVLLFSIPSHCKYSTFSLIVRWGGRFSFTVLCIWVCLGSAGCSVQYTLGFLLFKLLIPFCVSLHICVPCVSRTLGGELELVMDSCELPCMYRSPTWVLHKSNKCP